MTCARLILAMILVVGTASIASAECGWLLWVKMYFSGPHETSPRDKWWEVESGHPTQSKCTKERDRLFEHHDWVKKQESEITGYEGNQANAAMTWTDLDSGKNHTRLFKCFPDTIDPREKKE